MSYPEEKRFVDRRTLIKGAAAFGLSAITCRADEELIEGPASESTENSETGGTGLRVYEVVPASSVGHFGFASQQDIKPVPRRYSWRLRSQGVKAAKGRLGGAVEWRTHYFVWTSLSEANKLAKHEKVKSISAVTPFSLVELGEPTSGNGTLAVKLFAGPITGVKKRKIGIAEQVTTKWKKEFKGIPGVTVSLPAKSKEPFAHGMQPEPDQVIIEFKGRLDERALKIIKSHPRTIAIRWGDLFSFFSCPGCGLG